MSDLVLKQPQGPSWAALLDRLAQRAAEVDQTDRWPAESLADLARAGVLGWLVPTADGGQSWRAVDVTRGYVDLAASCLVTTFVLSQCNAAIQRIVDSTNDAVRAELLPSLARGEQWATVGISHLSTSRQHLSQPVVRIVPNPGGYTVEGEIPWVTGGGQVDHIVTGGTLPDGQQLLLAIPSTAAGVRCETPVRLLALSGSATGRVRLENVQVPDTQRVAGPSEAVMRSSSGGTGSLATSALAVGVGRRAVELLEREGERRVDIASVAASFRDEWSRLFEDLLRAAAGEIGLGQSSESIRGRANSFALRATQAALTATKGAGFVAGHPAERMVREAMFFLVWSCPQPVASAALREFACLVD